MAWYSWKLLPRRMVILFVLGGSVFIIGKLLCDSFLNNVSDLFLEPGIVQGIDKVFQYVGSFNRALCYSRLST